MTTASDVVRGLVSSGITHVVGVPDNTSGPLFDALTRYPTIDLVTVTREGEAFAIASGLWMGGAEPLVVIQNTGLLESGDALRGTAGRMGAPVPFVVTGRGYAKMRAAGIRREDARTRELLTRIDVDSTALLTESTLEAWGVPFELCEADANPAEMIRQTITEARSLEAPVALVLTRGLE